MYLQAIYLISLPASFATCFWTINYYLAHIVYFEILGFIAYIACILFLVEEWKIERNINTNLFLFETFDPIQWNFMKWFAFSALDQSLAFSQSCCKQLSYLNGNIFGEISFSHKIWRFMAFWLVDTVIIWQNNEISWDFGLTETWELGFWLKLL